MNRPGLILALLGVTTFSVGAWLQPRLVRTGDQHESASIMQVVFGEGRRMFANHFAIKADVYMHSGFYPSIFDQAAAAAKAEEEAAAQHTDDPGHIHGPDCKHDHAAGPATQDEHDHEKCDHDYLGQPRDWIEAFGRHFLVTEHTHLDHGKEREILPWLRIAAELDPQRIETYTVAAYWLAERMNKPAEAERFLRLGLKSNPQSYELLAELGKIYRVSDPDRARNVWRLALRRWDETETGKEKPDTTARHGILLRLGELEEAQGRLNDAALWFEAAKRYSPNPAALDERIGALWLKPAVPAPAPPKH